MIKKTQKNTPLNRAEIARPAARPLFGHITPLQKKLKAPRGRVFKIIAESKALSAISARIRFILKFCAKRWFKRLLKGGLKKIAESGLRSLTCFLIKRRKGRFLHEQMV